MCYYKGRKDSLFLRLRLRKLVGFGEKSLGVSMTINSFLDNFKISFKIHLLVFYFSMSFSESAPLIFKVQTFWRNFPSTLMRY